MTSTCFNVIMSIHWYLLKSFCFVLFVCLFVFCLLFLFVGMFVCFCFCFVLFCFVLIFSFFSRTQWGRARANDCAWTSPKDWNNLSRSKNISICSRSAVFCRINKCIWETREKVTPPSTFTSEIKIMSHNIWAEINKKLKTIKSYL